MGCYKAYKGFCYVLFVQGSMLSRLKAAGSSFILTTPLMIVFWHGAVYYEDSPPLWQLTAANFEHEWGSLAVIMFWCALLFLFRSMVDSMPRQPRWSVGREESGWLARALYWFLWFCVVFMFSLPSIIYAFAQSLPADNTLPVNELLLLNLHKLAPLLAVFLDMALASRISSRYSAWSGIKTDRLLMALRLFSSWFLALLITIALDENCLSRWKLTWTVCHSQQGLFTWELYGEEILNTQRDICQVSRAWYSDGRCARAIVGLLVHSIL